MAPSICADGAVAVSCRVVRHRAGRDVAQPRWPQTRKVVWLCSAPTDGGILWADTSGRPSACPLRSTTGSASERLAPASAASLHLRSRWFGARLICVRPTVVESCRWLRTEFRDEREMRGLTPAPGLSSRDSWSRPAARHGSGGPESAPWPRVGDPGPGHDGAFILITPRRGCGCDRGEAIRYLVQAGMWTPVQWRFSVDDVQVRCPKLVFTCSTVSGLNLLLDEVDVPLNSSRTLPGTSPMASDERLRAPLHLLLRAQACRYT